MWRWTRSGSRLLGPAGFGFESVGRPRGFESRAWVFKGIGAEKCPWERSPHSSRFRYQHDPNPPPTVRIEGTCRIGLVI